MEGFQEYHSLNQTGTLLTTILQLRNQVEFMDQFLSLVYPDYSHMKNIVTESQRQLAAMSGLLPSVVTYPGTMQGPNVTLNYPFFTQQQQQQQQHSQAQQQPQAGGGGVGAGVASPPASNTSSTVNVSTVTQHQHTCCNNNGGGSASSEPEARKAKIAAEAPTSAPARSPKRRGRKRKYPLKSVPVSEAPAATPTTTTASGVCDNAKTAASTTASSSSTGSCCPQNAASQNHEVQSQTLCDSETSLPPSASCSESDVSSNPVTYSVITGCVPENQFCESVNSTTIPMIPLATFKQYIPQSGGPSEPGTCLDILATLSSAMGLRSMRKDQLPVVGERITNRQENVTTELCEVKVEPADANQNTNK